MSHMSRSFCRATFTGAILAGLTLADPCHATAPPTETPPSSTPGLLPSHPAVALSCQAVSTDPGGSVSLSMKPSSVPHTVQYQAEAQSLTELGRRFLNAWKDEAFQRCGKFRGLWTTPDGRQQRVEGKTAQDVLDRLKTLGAKP